MPYKNIYWIKLEKRLLNDARFFQLNEKTQLLFIKFLLLSAETNNKIPKNANTIKALIRSKSTPKTIEKCIADMRQNFPKIKEKDGYYYFQEWDNRVNWTTEKERSGSSQGSAEGVPREGAKREEKRREDKRREEGGNNKFINMWKTFKKNNLRWKR